MLIIIYDIWSKGPYLHFFQFVTITTTYFLNTYHLSNLLSSSWNHMRIIISSYDDPHIIIRVISVSIVNPCFILLVTLFGQTAIIVSESLVKLTFFRQPVFLPWKLQLVDSLWHEQVGKYFPLISPLWSWFWESTIYTFRPTYSQLFLVWIPTRCLQVGQYLWMRVWCC